jgi:hypothetical protein
MRAGPPRFGRVQLCGYTGRPVPLRVVVVVEGGRGPEAAPERRKGRSPYAVCAWGVTVWRGSKDASTQRMSAPSGDLAKGTSDVLGDRLIAGGARPPGSVTERHRLPSQLPNPCS